MLVFSTSFFINFICNFLVTLVFIILLILLILLLTKIKIELKNIGKSTKLIFKLYFLNTIRYLKIELDREKILDIIKKAKIQKLENDITDTLGDLYFKRKNIKKIMDDLKIEIDYLNLDLKIGTEFIMLTSVIIITLSTIFPMILNKFVKKSVSEDKYKYKFTPIYNRNALNLTLHCIISIKVFYIVSVAIKVLYRLKILERERAFKEKISKECYATTIK